ncbi:MAG: helix-turn-helix transcriptional regulator [Lachnospiraceae bacterium]|nr:helix-turn-helix transcriptional regulator [Lachnospiraceae bacterium]
MDLADKIAKLRKQNGWSQEELAARLDISRQAVSKWESKASVPDLDKIVKMSSIFGVTTDYLLKDEPEKNFSGNGIISDSAYAEHVHGEQACTEHVYTEQTGAKGSVTADCRETLKTRRISREEAEYIVTLERKFAWRTALAVALLILSPVSLIVMSGLAEYGDGIILEGTRAVVNLFGFGIFMFLVPAGVMMLIRIGMQRSSYGLSGLEEEKLVLDYGVAEKLKEEKASFEGTYQNCTLTGIVLCMLSVVPLVMAAFIMDGAEDNRSDLIYIFCTAVLLVMVAAAVYLLIWSGSIHGNYDKLLQQGDYTVEKKEQNRKNGFFPGIYWCTVTAVYLGISLYFSNWSRSWIIWPVAGVLFAAFMGIINTVTAKKGR